MWMLIVSVMKHARARTHTYADKL